MAHLMSLHAVLELVAAAATLWTETNPVVLVGTLAMGTASTFGAILRYCAASSDEEEWEASLARAKRT